MSGKFLYIFATVMIGLSAGYYYFSGQRQQLEGSQQSNLMYAAQDVRVLKTDEQGQVHLTATMDSLQQDMKTQQSHLKQVNAQLFEQGQLYATFFAPTVEGYNDYQKVVLSDQIVAKRFAPQGEMTLTTSALIVYPKTKQIEGHQPLTVQSRQANFSSQGLKANLNTGEYEFFKIRGLYAK